MNIRTIPMKRTILILLLVALGSMTVPDARLAADSLSLAPVHGKPVVITVSGKDKKYYLLTKTDPVKFEVDGPAKLSVFTRLLLRPQGSGIEQYSVKVMEGGTLVKEYTTSTQQSDATCSDPQAVPGKSRKFSLAVPEGTHVYELTLDQTSLTEAAIRINAGSSASSSAQGKMTTMEPLSFDRVVTINSSEKLITYYVCSRKKEIELRVIGPTRLDVAARLIFDSKMQGEQNYGVGIWEGAKQIMMKSFSSTRAMRTTFEDWKEVVPGKLNSLSIAVPKGRHIFRLALSGASAGPVAMKFSVPSKDVGNEVEAR